MTEYPIKRGHFRNIEGENIKRIVRDTFGSVDEKNGRLISGYGAIKHVSIGVKGKTRIDINLEMDTTVSDDVATDTRKVWNKFLQEVTGYTSKERAKKLKDMAKKGKL